MNETPCVEDDPRGNVYGRRTFDAKKKWTSASIWGVCVCV